jgi:hypothetical protein
MKRSRSKPLYRLIAVALSAAAASCASYEQSGLPGSASSMARDRIMQVRREPLSFGLIRLSSLERSHPELRQFLAVKGMPDYLAETSNSGRSYYILYYLVPRQAFAVRTKPGGRGLEFAGPYPVTEGEVSTLGGIGRPSE